jgi:hypothetical protein
MAFAVLTFQSRNRADRRGLRSQFSRFHLVDIAPDPGFSGFDGANQWMLGVMKMFGRMFVFRRITATDMSADEAHSQVDPLISHLRALFADVRCGFADFDLIEVRAFLRHRTSSALVGSQVTTVTLHERE